MDKVFELIQREQNRQNSTIELIASENFVSENVLKAAGSCLTNKYAEGYPGRRYYGGCEVVDELEEYCRQKWQQVFATDYTNASRTMLFDIHKRQWDPEILDKYLGDAAEWDRVEGAMREILDDIGLEYTEEAGEAAFYGPKLDIQAKNVYGKEDTMITIQLDMFLAERFDMYYIDQNGDKKRPYIIHRTSLGCYERTLAWLIEKYAGKFPTWLCPEQVRVLPISEKYADYAEKVLAELKKNGIDATVDNRSEKIGYKIREARLDKLPYMLVVGAKEEEENKVSVRSRFAGDEGVKDLSEFIDAICKEIRTKEIRKEEPQDQDNK